MRVVALMVGVVVMMVVMETIVADAGDGGARPGTHIHTHARTHTHTHTHALTNTRSHAYARTNTKNKRTHVHPHITFGFNWHNAGGSAGSVTTIRGKPTEALVAARRLVMNVCMCAHLRVGVRGLRCRVKRLGIRV